jgi:hypothetical protein
VGVGVAVGVAAGDLSVPPGFGRFELVLWAGAGSGRAVLGAAADEAGLGCGRTAWLALGLGCVLGGDGVVLAEATRTASASSTGMAAGCWTRPLTWLSVRVLGIIPAVVALGAGLLAAEVVQAFVAAWRVACTPVSIMLAAP